MSSIVEVPATGMYSPQCGQFIAPPEILPPHSVQEASRVNPGHFMPQCGHVPAWFEIRLRHFRHLIMAMEYLPVLFRFDIAARGGVHSPFSPGIRSGEEHLSFLTRR
jgi:hypothetical protein